MTYDFNPFKSTITTAEEWLKKELQQIRTGQASPAILDNVRVDSYGSVLGLKEVASVTIEGARSIRITPWDASHTKDIEAAIGAANLGLSVSVDGQGVRVTFPELTSDRRTEMAKIAKDKLEDSKKQVRHSRDNTIKDLQVKEKEGGYGKDDIFRLKNDLQKMVDEANKKLDDMYSKKEKELLN
jgi:ribosome recycling factor